MPAGQLGGGEIYDDDMCVTPQGRPDFVALGLKTKARLANRTSNNHLATQTVAALWGVTHHGFSAQSVVRQTDDPHRDLAGFVRQERISLHQRQLRQVLKR